MSLIPIYLSFMLPIFPSQNMQELPEECKFRTCKDM